MDDGRTSTSKSSPTELTIRAHVWESNIHGKHHKATKREDRHTPKPSSTGNEEDSPRKLRERSSWMSNSRWPSSSTSPNGQWKPVKLRLSHTRSSTSSPCELAVACTETSRLLHSISVHLLAQTDVRPAHHSLFFRKHVLGFHCGPGQAFGLSPQMADPHEAPLRPSPTPYSSTTPTPYAPLYVLFPSVESHDAWLALIRSHALPEAYGNPATGHLYRTWRGIDMEIVEGRHILGSSSGSMSSSSGQRSSQHRNGGDDGVKETSSSSSHYDIFVEIYLGSVLVGRTTSKRASRSSSAHSNSIQWNERFHWNDLPPHGQLTIKVWKIKAEKEKHPISTTPTPGRLKSSVSASISGGVALINNASGVNRKEREPQLVGRIQVALPNFPRGEWTEGLWAAVPLTSPVTTWCQTTPELKIKIKVDETIILPSEAYANLESILRSTNAVDLLTPPAVQPAIGPSNLSFLPPSHLTLLTGHLHHVSLASSTLVPSLCDALRKEIASIADDLALKSSTSPNTLFRGNSALTKTMEFAMMRYGRAWLDKSLASVVRDLIAGQVCIETDVATIEKRAKKDLGGESVHKELEENVVALGSWCHKIWKAIWQARDHCPNDLRMLFHTIRTVVDDRFASSAPKPSSKRAKGKSRKGYTESISTESESETDGKEAFHKDLKWQAISAFVFLRFFVPAILNPHIFGLVDGLPSSGVHRTLKLIAKTMQSLANLNSNVNNQEHMRIIKDFLTNQMNVMIDFLLFVSSPILDSTGSPPSSDKGSVEDHLKTRVPSLPPLHRESVPMPPHMIDYPRHLAMIASTVVRNAAGERRPSWLPTDQTTRTAQDEFHAACFEVEAEALRCVNSLRSNNSTSKLPTAADARQIPRSRSLSKPRVPTKATTLDHHRSRESVRQVGRPANSVRSASSGPMNGRTPKTGLSSSNEGGGRRSGRDSVSPSRSSSRVSSIPSSTAMTYRLPAAASSSDSNISGSIVAARAMINKNASESELSHHRKPSSRPSTAPSNGSSADSYRRQSLRHAASYSRLLLREDLPPPPTPPVPIPGPVEEDNLPISYTAILSETPPSSQSSHAPISLKALEPAVSTPDASNKKNRFLRTIFKAR